MKQRPRPELPSKEELTALLIPIGKRMPAYLRLGLAVAREPSIPLLHRSGLYATVVYVVTPAHVVISAIPVLGQVDLILLLLLSLRQALKHCPQETLERLCARVKLKPDQLHTDLQTIAQLTRQSTQALSYSMREKAPQLASAGKSAAFAGRVANGFTRRVARRLRPAPS